MRDFEHKLAGISGHIEAAMAGILKRSAEYTADLARGLAPVDSGRLRDGIRVEAYGGTGAAVISAAAHSAMVEYGTSRMPPQPYLLPAAEAARVVYFEAAATAVREVLK